MRNGVYHSSYVFSISITYIGKHTSSLFGMFTYRNDYFLLTY